MRHHVRHRILGVTHAKLRSWLPISVKYAKAGMTRAESDSVPAAVSVTPASESGQTSLCAISPKCSAPVKNRPAHDSAARCGRTVSLLVVASAYYISSFVNRRTREIGFAWRSAQGTGHPFAISRLSRDSRAGRRPRVIARAWAHRMRSVTCRMAHDAQCACYRARGLFCAAVGIFRLLSAAKLALLPRSVCATIHRVTRLSGIFLAEAKLSAIRTSRSRSSSRNCAPRLQRCRRLHISADRVRAHAATGSLASARYCVM